MSVLAALFAFCAGALADHHEEGFVSLFNGKDLKGWDGDPKYWSARDGVITGQTTTQNPTPNNTFLIWRDGKVEDFELRLSYKIVGGNSGIQYRSTDKGKWIVGGYQADFEAGKTYSGILYEEGGRGILAQRGQVTVIKPAAAAEGKHQVEVLGSVGRSEDLQAVIKAGDWNEYTIVARGNMMTHLINGRVTVIVRDDHQAKRAMSGILALQVHQGPPMTLQVKNIRLKTLK